MGTYSKAITLFIIFSLYYYFHSPYNAYGESGSDDIPILNFEEFKPMLEKDNDTLYVINFWATWCSPCVQEIPYFERINKEYLNQKVRVILVSLDFRSQFETRLIPFVEARQMESMIIMLDDPRSNRWIPLVSKEWTGSIPATVIYKGDNRRFYEKVFTYEELETEILNFIN